MVESRRPFRHFGQDLPELTAEHLKSLHLPGMNQRIYADPPELSRPEGPEEFNLVSSSNNRIPDIATIRQDGDRVYLEVLATDAETANSIAWTLALTLIDDYDMMHDGDLKEMKDD